MLIADLSPKTIARIRKLRYDRIVEKHEGPEQWDTEFKYLDPGYIADLKQRYPEYDPEAERPEFLNVDGHWVLLPIGNAHHSNLSILHYFLSAEGHKLVLYLKDTTYDDSIWGAGFVAICDLWLPEEFYLASFYHEWFIIDYDDEAKRLFVDKG